MTCCNAVAESYWSERRIEIVKNKNNLNIYFNFEGVLSIIYEGIINHNIVCFSPVFNRHFVNEYGSFKGACKELCNDLMSIPLIDEASYDVTKQCVKLKFSNKIKALTWKGRLPDQHKNMYFEMRSIETIQKYLRIFRKDIPGNLTCLELLNILKNSEVTFNSEATYFNYDDDCLDVPFSINQSHANTHITTELLFTRPYSKFITIRNDENNSFTFVVETKRLRINCQNKNAISLDFYDNNNNLIPGVTILINKSIYFSQYIEKIIRINENNTIDSQFFLAKSHDTNYVFLSDDQEIHNNKHIIINLVEHKRNEYNKPIQTESLFLQENNLVTEPVKISTTVPFEPNDNLFLEIGGLTFSFRYFQDDQLYEDISYGLKTPVSIAQSMKDDNKTWAIPTEEDLILLIDQNKSGTQLPADIFNKKIYIAEPTYEERTFYVIHIIDMFQVKKEKIDCNDMAFLIFVSHE